MEARWFPVAPRVNCVHAVNDLLGLCVRREPRARVLISAIKRAPVTMHAAFPLDRVKDARTDGL